MTGAAPPSESVFTVRDGALHCEQVALERIAGEVGTPAYVYSTSAVEQAYLSIDAALDFTPHMIAYAVKANGNPELLARLGRLGSGADIVSGGELALVLHAGIPAHRVVFSGVGKQDAEIEAALEARIRSIHVESTGELEAIAAIARRRGIVAPVALRVNPDVDPKTHPYIATGLHESKFGLDIATARALVDRIRGTEALELHGLATHIGSQLRSVTPLEDAVAIVGSLARELVGAGVALRSLDVGGGWALAYGDEDRRVPTHAEYGQGIRRGLERSGALDLDLEIIVEPGRTLVGNAGVLLTRVLYVKERGDKRFVIVDAGMTELIRPALYQAYHTVEPVRPPAHDAPRSPADVVGPVCETSDFLALDRPLPPLRRGDLLAVRSAGAYAASMASHYNARPRAPEVLVQGPTYRTV